MVDFLHIATASRRHHVVKNWRVVSEIEVAFNVKEGIRLPRTLDDLCIWHDMCRVGREGRGLTVEE